MTYWQNEVYQRIEYNSVNGLIKVEKVTKVISSEEFVIERVKKGDALAFEELFNTYYKKLKHFTCQITKSDYFAEEITQEVFVNIWLNRDKINPALSFNGYIYRVARNLTINHLKKLLVHVNSIGATLFKHLNNQIETTHSQT